jgi:hypothetical protein
VTVRNSAVTVRNSAATVRTFAVNGLPFMLDGLPFVMDGLPFAMKGLPFIVIGGPDAETGVSVALNRRRNHMVLPRKGLEGRNHGAKRPRLIIAFHAAKLPGLT